MTYKFIIIRQYLKVSLCDLYQYYDEKKLIKKKTKPVFQQFTLDNYNDTSIQFTLR